MIPKRLLSVDVDLTVVNSDYGWWKYLYDKSVEDYETFPYFDQDEATAPYNYDLSKYYNNREECFDYWRDLDYSKFKPIEGSVEKLKALSQYFGIVFISAHKGTHGKSKYYWLEEHFPFANGVMLTKEKFLMNASVVAHIDDRKSMLKGFDSHKRVLYSTPYTQDVDCGVAMTIEDWKSFSVEDFCDNYL